MKTRKLLLIAVGLLAFLVVVIIGVDSLNTEKLGSRDGCRAITGIDLPLTIRILEYKVINGGIADDPNHMWLLQSDDGFEALNKRVADFTLGGAEQTKSFGEEWPELKDPYRGKQVGRVIMGIGTGRETLFISSDDKFAILGAFRD